ncbi:ATP-binding cassette domain-containing protein [Nocardioides convexus]|uniref:ATP-binding cassette domain-containing protein n=1 Tax=Nocardioides convexus TaxID=2712224 RepID=UPI0024185B23|nr:ATP-binding cassette domain-containing protein [Nocardioides convexus]
MFVGPSGCGKTTSLKMINRLIEPTSGTITIDGVDIRKQSENEPAPAHWLRHPGRQPLPAHDGGAQHRRRAAPPRLGLRADPRPGDRACWTWSASTPTATAAATPRRLSGGQQQRVGVARGLAADPPVILMDEPFGAVDPITRQRLQDEPAQHPARDRQDDRVRHARHRRGDQARGPDPDLARGRAGRPVRHPGGRPLGAGRRLRGRLRRCRLLAQGAHPRPGRRGRAPRDRDRTHRRVRRGGQAACRGSGGELRGRARRARPSGGLALPAPGSAGRASCAPRVTSSTSTSAPRSTTRSTPCSPGSHGGAVVTGDRDQFLGVIDFASVTDHIRALEAEQ